MSFYSNPDLDDGFGATANRSRPHRGLDFPHREGTAIPSVSSGKVVISEWSDALGWVIEIEYSHGVYMGFCHLQKRGLAVGTEVVTGDTIGFVGNTGTESFGAHVHITKGNKKGAVFGASMSNLSDPWPYIAGSGVGTGAITSDWAFNKPDKEMQARIQKALKARGRYSGPVDGVWGANTIKGIQTSIKGVGYAGAVDGIPGASTCKHVQEYARKFGDYKGPVDSVLGINTWAGFALGLERP